MKDLRDPVLLGEALVESRDYFGKPLSQIYDDFRGLLEDCPDYDHNPGPIEKYGDPRLIPSTMPNAVD